MGIATSLQAIQTITTPGRSYWKVMLTTGKELTENKLVWSWTFGGLRPVDWALDLNSTGDWQKIKELWLMCPNGQQAMLRIEEPGTAFQFKHGYRDFFGGAGQSVEAQCIGKVTSKETGDCTCWIWDRVLGLIQYDSNILKFGSWRPDSGLIPLGRLSEDVCGLRLG